MGRDDIFSGSRYIFIDISFYYFSFTFKFIVICICDSKRKKVIDIILGRQNLKIFQNGSYHNKSGNL